MKRLTAGMVMAVLAAVPVAAQDATEGQALFERYCATCHGLDADGQGPMAPALVLQPTNLTALAATNGGEFPLLRVIRRIDGRDPLVSHGSPMPVFGDFFEGGRDVSIAAPSGQPIMTSQPVADLVAWLQTIQQ